MDPFQQTTYEMALYEAGQLTADELRTTLKQTLPAMKAVLDAEAQPDPGAPAAPQY